MLKTLKMGNKEIELASYMTSLPTEVVEYLSTLADASDIIVAAGVDEKDHSVVFLTGSGEARQIIPNGKTIPVHARPSYDGRHVFLSVDGKEGLYPIESKLAITVSESCLSGATISVNNLIIGSLDAQVD